MSSSRGSCVHHWLLADEIRPLPPAKAREYPNCWGRPATCRKCGRTSLQLEFVEELPSARSLRRSATRPAVSDLVPGLLAADDAEEDWVVRPEVDLGDLELNL